MGGAIPFLSEQALARCSNYDDQSTAVSIYTAYCSAKGYTEVVSPSVDEVHDKRRDRRGFEDHAVDFHDDASRHPDKLELAVAE
ncbi:unnamed protein product [Parascedosporium putredinis]|uniref:Uncharacterized protein n=1 Tax=Parascedosporium putredinis TaxID=1442378 RepID=A0A9P1M7L0_9PEZI|nr:unnamed protein product [Parascedosporium putredinis]CAI7988480.1 unnamed protein product [Parascedosporium putredinis]